MEPVYKLSDKEYEKLSNTTREVAQNRILYARSSPIDSYASDPARPSDGVVEAEDVSQWIELNLNTDELVKADTYKSSLETKTVSGSI